MKKEKYYSARDENNQYCVYDRTTGRKIKRYAGIGSKLKSIIAAKLFNQGE